MLVGGAVAIAAVVAVVVAVAGNGESSPSPAEVQFIARVDRICARNRRAFEEARAKFPKGDNSPVFPLIRYAEALVDTSTPTVEQLAALRPPESIRAAYEQYVEAEKQIYYDDVTAVGAAHAVHTEEYLAARKRQRGERRKGYELAREIGLDKCASH